MCGFVGYVNRAYNNNESIIMDMCNEIRHRGEEHHKHIDDNVVLGFQRLSIVGSHSGSQPMTDATDKYIITFNGEIYNYKELRTTLIEKGHTFNTECDTEVILNGYIEYGTEVLNHLRGMFAFVIYEKDSKKLFGARDHFGIKPLYYYNNEETFLYGSEIKSFLKHPDFKKEFNEEALMPYLTFQTNMLEETFFKNVFKLLPAHYFVYENDQLTIEKYYEYDFTRTISNEDEARALLEKSINESIGIHSDTDKVICSFLSSGIDSSLITAIVKPHQTYSIGFSSMFNESVDAKRLCELLNIENKSLTVEADEIFENLSNIVYHLDEPQANPSLIPLYFLAKEAAKDYEIVLTGEGADELFGGYYLYDLNLKFEKYDKLPLGLRNTISSVFKKFNKLPKAKFFIDGNKSIEERFIGQAKIFDEAESKKFLKTSTKHTVKSITQPIYDQVKDCDYITKMQYLDLHLWQPNDILLKADKMTMAHTLEGRVPYLDIKMFEVARKLDPKFLIKNHEVKTLLRSVAHNKLPNEWVKREKMGFPVPVKDWLRTELGYNYAKDLFNKEWTSKFFDTTYINKLLDEHYNQTITEQRKIWTILIFLVWYNRFFESN